MRAYHWTYEQIDSCTFGEIMDIVEDWRENPPLVHLVEALVYGFSGGKKPQAENTATSTDQLGPAAEVVTLTRGAIALGPKPKTPPIILDIEEMREKQRRYVMAEWKRVNNVRD